MANMMHCCNRLPLTKSRCLIVTLFHASIRLRRLSQQVFRKTYLGSTKNLIKRAHVTFFEMLFARNDRFIMPT